MTAPVDTRDVIDRAEDVAAAADWELRHPNLPLSRCVCGATLIVGYANVEGFVCAGCGAPASLTDRFSSGAGAL